MTAAGKTCDVLVLGSGASGLTAAVTAAKAGLDVIVCEKEPIFGGTTATSGGVLWIPGNRHSAEVQKRLGRTDSLDDARIYLDKEAGNYINRPKVEAYLANGPRMVDFLEQNTEVKFYGMEYPDYHAGDPGSSIVRSIGTVDYDARKLGKHLKQLKNQLPQTLFMGLAVGSGVEMKQFMKAGRSVLAMGFVLRKMARHVGDLVRYGESQQMVRGRALIARLARTLFDLGVPLWLSSPARRLIAQGGRVVGAVIATPEGEIDVRARHGVVLACGGYPHDRERRLQTYPAPMATRAPLTVAPSSNTGDGTRMAEAVGGQFTAEVSNVAAWMPVSTLPGAKDSSHVWPHLVERQKPGFIMVLKSGRRFGDEAGPYHDLVPAMVRALAEEGSGDCAWEICDTPTLKRWGIGFVRPFPVPHGHYLRNGYLQKADTIEALAAALGIDPAGLAATVRAFNADAREGKDPDFNRGQTIYDLYHGDDEVGPNPCLGPIETGPFYGVKILPAEIGNFAGLKTDERARVLDRDGAPIDGLYAVGNDQVSVFGGAYPGAGSTLGPAMTFGFIAGNDLATRAGRAAVG